MHYHVVSVLLVMVTSVSSLPLLVSHLLKAGNVSQARNLSSVHLDSVYAGPSHAGFFTADADLGNHLFFWFFPSTTNDNAPLVVWLNGGPGVSSLVGLFFENGPVDMTTHRYVESSNTHWYPPGVTSFTPRNSSWVGPFSMLYIDNPVGAGFSFSTNRSAGLRRDRNGYTGDIYRVMVQFYQMFPEYHDRELYIGGQSYAGKYVPALANRIHFKNKNNGIKLPLAGIYLGSPFFAPQEMSYATQDFLFNLGFLSKADVEEYRNQLTNLFDNFTSGEIGSTRDIMKTVLGQTFKPINNYNFVSADNYRKLYYDLWYFLRNPSIKEAIHVGILGFRPIRGNVYDALNHDILVSTKDKLKTVLENYKVLVYNGDYDITVNTPGIEAGLMATPWAGRADYAAAQRLLWRSPTAVKGFFSYTGNLCRVVVHGAGHWAPRDRPEATLEMMNQFVTHGCVRNE